MSARRYAGAVVACSVTVVLAACQSGGGGSRHGTHTAVPSPPGTTVTETVTVTAPAAPAEAPSPTSGFVNPLPSHFSIMLKVLRKQCFGSAGCNVTVDPRLSTTVLGRLDPSITYALTFRITGDESGPVVDTMTVTGDQYQAQEKHLSTSDSGVVPRARVTSVEES